MKINVKLAKTLSYDSSKRRSLKDIKYIVIHYTGNNNDSASGNANYFATSNTRQAGAHFFVDKKGIVFKSVNMNRTAWSVGGFYDNRNGAGSYYEKCTNYNSVSIELCDCVKGSNSLQMESTRQLVKYIRRHCPNADTIIRHWDVNGKDCPLPMIGKNNVTWKHFKKYIVHGYQFKAKVIKDAHIRTKGNISGKTLRIAKKGEILKIKKVSSGWGYLGKNSNGDNRWVSMKKVKELE